MTAETDDQETGPPAPPAPETPPATASLPRGARSFFGARASHLIGAVLVIILVGAGVFLAKRQLSRSPTAQEAATPGASASSPGIVGEPVADAAETPLAGGEPLAQEKIFNSISGDVKTGADALAREAGENPVTPPAGLPPPPAGPGANQLLQDAAKDAAKRFSPGSAAPAEIDLSSPDAGAALERLERAAGADAPPAESGPQAQAGDGAAAAEIARLSAALAQERQHTERQSAEVDRLAAEIAMLKAEGAPAARKAEAVLALVAAEEKLRAGLAFRTELEAVARLTGAAPAPALSARASAGLAAPDALKAAFPLVRDEALAAARRERARGLLSRFSANLATLVRLRRAAPAPGEGPAEVISRSEALVGAGDLKAAAGELDALSGAARDRAASWIADASAFYAAEEALAAMRASLAADLQAGRS